MLRIKNSICLKKVRCYFFVSLKERIAPLFVGYEENGQINLLKAYKIIGFVQNLIDFQIA
ncbi:hypothetical protein M2148_001939 [Lachnospiraceae bacterium PF1-4]